MVPIALVFAGVSVILINVCGTFLSILFQLHHTFVAGLYKCTAFQAVNISAVAACAEFPGLEVRAGSLV